MGFTRAGRALSGIEAVSDAVVASTWPERSHSDRIGIEIEAFPIELRGGLPGPRFPLHGPRSVISVIEDIVAAAHGVWPRSSGSLAYPTSGGGRLTFEPGGQIEHSSKPQRYIASLRAEIDQIWDELSVAFGERGVGIVSLGLDPWHGVEEVPQQQRADRYQAMDGYFSNGWPAGAVMMRNTCSVQVNLDAGSEDQRPERWLAANLISPVLTAMFATSPGPDGTHSRRARTWQQIDPTRTGFPDWSHGPADPIRDTVTKATAANVMMIRRHGRALALTPGWSLSTWAEEGHREHGSPTLDDVANHLSTLFPEVRPREGVLEMRAVDALSRRWWLVPAVIAGAVIYDDDARSHVIEMLARHTEDLPSVWKRAALGGLTDPGLRGDAEKLGRLGLEAAGRSPQFDTRALRDTEAFLDRFTLRGLAPAEELSPLLDRPHDALLWADVSDSHERSKT